MPGPLFHVGATANCPHGGPITTISSNSRVLVSGMQVATAVDQSAVAGCAFNVSGKPQPCVLVKWLAPAVRVKVNGTPPILRTSAAVCQSAEQAPQGPPLVTVTQPRVIAT